MKEIRLFILFLPLSFLFFTFSGCIKKISTESVIVEKPSLRQTIRNSGYLTNIYFDISSTDLALQSKDSLARTAQLQAISKTDIYLIGHSDTTGIKEKNMILSEKRTESVKNYLIELGVDSGKVHTFFLGDERPLQEGNTPEDHSKNRCVEVVLTRNEKITEIIGKENIKPENLVKEQSETPAAEPSKKNKTSDNEIPQAYEIENKDESSIELMAADNVSIEKANEENINTDDVILQTSEKKNNVETEKIGASNKELAPASDVSGTENKEVEIPEADTVLNNADNRQEDIQTLEVDIAE